MAFALLYNLYTYIKNNTEKRVTIAFVGLDGAGKVSSCIRLFAHQACLIETFIM